jgi:rRNA maturation RNase YbeY
VRVEVANRTRRKRPALRTIKKKAGSILALLRQNDTELSIALVGNREIRRLNARYRHKDAPTDVLSFPGDDVFPTDHKLLGDVVISVEQAAKQAKQKGRSLDAEVEILLVHGILHLLGYDHERSQRDARIMHRLETKLLRALGAKRK